MIENSFRVNVTSPIDVAIGERVFFAPSNLLLGNYVTGILLHNPPGQTVADYYQQLGCGLLTLIDCNDDVLLYRYPFSDLVNRDESTGAGNDYGNLGYTRMFQLKDVDLSKSYIEVLNPVGPLVANFIIAVVEFYYSNKKTECQFA